MHGPRQGAPATVSSVLPALRDALLDEGAAGAESITEWHLRCLAAYLRGGPSPRICLLYDLRSGSLDACHAAALAEDRERSTAEWFLRRYSATAYALPRRDHT